MRAALFAAGLLLALTGVLRLQLAPAILVVALAGCSRRPVRDWLIGAIGGALVVTAAGILDWATGGYPFQSFWANVEANLLHHKASQYGVSPWYASIGLYVVTWSGFTIPLAILALAGARRAPMLLILPLVIVASHSVIAHYEYRFVLPALPFVLPAAAVGTAEFIEAMKRVGSAFHGRISAAAALVSWTATSAILMLGDHFRPNLTKHAAGLAALAALREPAPMCGLGLLSIPWYYSGGYSYLHRDVPIYPIRTPEGLAATWDASDVALAEKDAPLPELGFHRESCYGATVCVFRRSRTCVKQTGHAINEVLRRRKE